jgi:cytochrome c-type biogenesis protein CcmE
MAVNPPPDALDLTPRSTPNEPSPKRNRKKNWPAVTLLAVALIGVAVVLFQGLSSATSYYCNADEVGLKSGCSGNQRFRLQGTVVKGTVKQSGEAVDFDVAFNGKTIEVHHRGAPQDLFKEGIAVVLEGTLAPASAGSGAVGVSAGGGSVPVFESDLMMVKHSEQYKAANPDRVSTDAP